MDFESSSSSDSFEGVESSLERVEELRDELDRVVSEFSSEVSSVGEELEAVEAAVERERVSLRRELSSLVDVDGVDEELLEAFVEKPYTMVPRGDGEAWVIVPRWVPFNVGWLERQDASYNHFVVNKYVNWISELPDEIRESVGIEREFDDVVVDGNMVEFSSEGERDRAWELLGGRDGGLYRRVDDEKIQIKRGKEFDVIAELVENGNLPFSVSPVDLDGLRADRSDIELRSYQERAWEKFLDTGMIGVYWPPGTGKTFLALYAGDRIPGQKLVIVPQKTLEEQWWERIREFCEYPSEWDVRTYQYLTYEDNMAAYNEDGVAFTVYDECLSGDTVVEMRSGRVSFREIDEAFGLSHGWNDVGELEVRTFDISSGVWYWDAVSGVFKDEQEVYEIETCSGRSLFATDSHTHIVVDGSTLEVKESSSVSVGDYLVSPEPGDGGQSSVSFDVSTVLSALQSNIDVSVSKLADWGGVSKAVIADGMDGVQEVSKETVVRIGENVFEYGRENGVDYAEWYGGVLQRLENVSCHQIASITSVGEQEVYDLEVGSHRFLADGFLTHNCHRLPAPTFSKLSTLDTEYRMGLTASPYREDDDTTKYIFALTGHPVGLNWDEFVELGVAEYPDVRVYLHRTQRQKVSTAEELATDPGKMVFFCDSITAGEQLSSVLDVPFVYGETTNRMDVFRNNRVVVSSRVGDEGMSLPSLSRVVEFDFHGGSRRQELQRAGRVMHNESADATEHIVLMTDEEYEKYGDRLLSLEEKGFNIEFIRQA